jgi:predicted nucleotidyltransferase
MGKANLFPDFRKLLESLNSAGVEYLVLGGYAVIHYGYRRTTDDLDIWIAIDPDNARKISRVLQEFGGFPPSKVKPSMFQVHGKVFIFGREPVRIDLLTSPSGLDFAASYARRNMVDWDGLQVPLISFEDLKANKRASGRAKDLADLENLPPSWPRNASRQPRRASERRKRRHGDGQ